MFSKSVIKSRHQLIELSRKLNLSSYIIFWRLSWFSLHFSQLFFCTLQNLNLMWADVKNLHNQFSFVRVVSSHLELKLNWKCCIIKSFITPLTRIFPRMRWWKKKQSLMKMCFDAKYRKKTQKSEEYESKRI